MFTTQHYIAIAGVINDAEISYDDTETVAEAFADRLEKDNPRFDRETFLIECGHSNPKGE